VIGQDDRQHCSTVLMSSKRRWKCQRRRQKGGQVPADSPFYAKQTSSGSKNVREIDATVEKRLHIHSSKCAEARFLLAKAFLSKFRSAPVQCFSSSSGST
jgi:hypothetical protein